MSQLGVFVVIWTALNLIITAAVVGKRREPITGGSAAITVTIDLLIIVAVVTGYLR